jgi:hypothetical protein
MAWVTSLQTCSKAANHYVSDSLKLGSLNTAKKNNNELVKEDVRTEVTADWPLPETIKAI